MPSGRLAVSTATTGTVLIAAAAFWLSFTALTDLARRSGIDAGQAWAWPLIVDGLIVVATVAVVALDGHRAAWYPWLLLIAGTLVSVVANALHATVAADADVPPLLAGCVAAVPPLVLLASTHLTVVLVRSHRARTSEEAEPPVAEAPVPSVSADPEPVAVLPEMFAATAPVPPTPLAPEVGRTERRMLAARLRDAGESNKAIARELGVAPSTVGRWFTKELDAGRAPDGQDDQKEQDA
ncbi:MAG: DUF2637 domain-containing protein [Actinobacteria bacterium]|nr:DUF2637 domain-containing protein [Actinomycetota bacterium]